jgi:sugar-specific transcriptional regulator TrmB
MRSCKIFTIILAAVILCRPQISCAVQSNDEILKKLNELSSIIQSQQKEIESLKRQLENQGKQIENVQETQKEEVKKEVEVATEEKAKQWSEKIPEWIKTTKVSGDLRLRYEGIFNREELQADGSTKDLPTRDRYRIRARLFFDGKISDEVSTHFMLCTNQDTVQEATTTNQSFSDDFNDKGIYLHRAYAKLVCINIYK